MNKLAVVRWPSKLEESTNQEFKELVTKALLNEKLLPVRVVVSQTQTSLYIRPHILKRGAMTSMIKKWHDLFYGKYREQRFEATPLTTLSFLYNGMIYRNMFPDSGEQDENGFFRFKITGTFEV